MFTCSAAVKRIFAMPAQEWCISLRHECKVRIMKLIIAKVYVGWIKMKMRNPITDRDNVRMLPDIFSLVVHLSKCVLLASSPHIMIPRLFPTSFSKSWPPGHIWNNPSSADCLFSRRGGKVGRGKWGRPILSPRVLPCDSRSGTHVQAHVLAEQGFVYSIQTNSIRHQKLLLQRSQLSKSLGWRHDVTATPVWV